ncbi:MAG: hypothetical protein JO227_23475 [Acetobacteraceae bacterium]|nr:hypothetical protein [Acetobacteraceae bacterium]
MSCHRIMQVCGLLALLPGSPAIAQQSDTGLKLGPDEDAVAANCSACHTLDYIRMNSVFVTPAGWKAEVAKMRQAFGAPIEDEAANAIVRYLNENYAAQPK